MANKKAISSNKKSTHSETKVSKPKANLTILDTVKPYLPFIAALAAEFIGTFLLVASTFAAQGQPLYIAFVLVGIILIVGGATNAQLNPAMTIGALATKKIKPIYAVGYIVTQLLGATTAWFVLGAFMGGNTTAASTTANPLFHAAAMTSGKEIYIFFAEILGSIVLALGVSSAMKSKDRITSAASYGLSILVAILIAGSATAIFLTESNTTLTFLNPATAIAGNALDWKTTASAAWSASTYLIAPIIGGVIGFALRDLLSYKAKNND